MRMGELRKCYSEVQKQIDSLIDKGFSEDIKERGDISLLRGNLSPREVLILYRGIEIGLQWAIGTKDQEIEHLECY